MALVFIIVVSIKMKVNGDFFDEDEDDITSNEIEVSPSSHMDRATSIGKQYVRTPIEEEENEDEEQDDLSRVYSVSTILSNIGYETTPCTDKQSSIDFVESLSKVDTLEQGLPFLTYDQITLTTTKTIEFDDILDIIDFDSSYDNCIDQFLRRLAMS